MDIRPQTAPLAALLVGLWVAGPSPVHGQPVGQSGGERTAWSFIPDVVRITAEWGDGDQEEGFGFVFGERDGILYIATADHVVRQPDKPLPKVTLRFSSDLGHGYAARLSDLRMPQGAGDLAILEMPKLTAVKPVWLPTIDMRDLPLGTHAWRIGKHEKFTPAVTPGVLSDKPGGILLEFDNLDTPQGSSGGPIVTENGLIGMVITDAGNAGPATVLPIGRIEIEATNWHLPWQLPRQGAAPQPSAASTSPVTPMPTRSGPPEPHAMSAESMEFASRQLIRQFFVTLSSDDATALAFVDRAYGRSVFIDGRSLSHSEILASRRDFFGHWPSRKYVPRPSSLASECRVGAATCRIDATVDWFIQNPAMPTPKKGTTYYTLSVSFKTEQPTIFAELAANSQAH